MYTFISSVDNLTNTCIKIWICSRKRKRFFSMSYISFGYQMFRIKKHLKSFLQYLNSYSKTLWIERHVLFSFKVNSTTNNDYLRIKICWCLKILRDFFSFWMINGKNSENFEELLHLRILKTILGNLILECHFPRKKKLMLIKKN